MDVVWILILVIQVPGPVDQGRVLHFYSEPDSKRDCVYAARDHHAEDELMCLELDFGGKLDG